tara:strand:- start:22091 stop:22297 length:207 start_codon:yes stop_codon:yes gene_type:complete
MGAGCRARCLSGDVGQCPLILLVEGDNVSPDVSAIGYEVLDVTKDAIDVSGHGWASLSARGLGLSLTI